MKVVGFTIIRNAVLYDYPIVEAISSILQLCDLVVVAVGNSTDETLALVRGINPEKIKIVETVWDDDLRKDGRTFALETDKAFQAVPPDADWAFYIQADEVIHEKYYPAISAALIRYKDVPQVDGLLFNYTHFYGSYDYVGDSWQWYRREIRIIKNNKRIFSYRDAQGFRKEPNNKLNVKLIDAFVYHYGWVKTPKIMQAKVVEHLRYYSNQEIIVASDEYDFSKINSLTLFNETHPAVMENRIKRLNWKFDHDISKKRITVKEKFKRLIKKLTGIRVGEYRNYKLI